LKTDKDKKKDKKIGEHRERISKIKNESEASFDETARVLAESLLKGLAWGESDLDFSEVQRAEELANKYSTEEWLYRE